MKHSRLGGSERGPMARIIKSALPLMLAFAPVAIAQTGGASVSSGARQGAKRFERVTSGNMFELDTRALPASEGPFSAFESPLGSVSGEPGKPDMSSAQAALDHDGATRAFLAENGLLNRASTDVVSLITGQSDHRAKRTVYADSEALKSSGFAGKPQFSGTCHSLSYCTSDFGNQCSYFVSGDAVCTGSRPPRINSASLIGAPASTATSVSFRVIFDEEPNAASVSADDFVVTTVSGTASGSVSSVVLIPGPSIPNVRQAVNNSFTVTVGTLAGNGVIRLDLKANTNIIDISPKTIASATFGAGGPFGNGNAGFTPAFSTGSTHTVALNSAPTGAVTITGTATENQTLTANTSTLADADGLGSFSYQWRRGGAPIAGATASTYTLVNADVGATITVTVSYTDGQSNAESVTSAATAAVVNVNDAPTGSVSISGTATENQVLTASNTLADADGLGAITYQWRRGGTPIAGATASTYTLVDADVGLTITVVANYTDGHGTAESVVSAATAAVVNVNNVPTGGVSISGTATEDQTLTANSTLADGDGLGVLQYQWLRNGATLVGATASTYTLDDIDVGGVMSLSVTYTDAHGTAEGPFTAGPTGAVLNVNDAPTGSVIISGTAAEDQTLTASNTLADDDGLGPISYQWQRGGAPIAGATASTYTLGDADVGQTITVVASYTDLRSTAESVTSSATAAVANVNDVPTGSVSIAGTATEDQVLTASNTLADADGLGPITYQWRRGGTPIAGASASTYTLVDADVGLTITVDANYTDLNGSAESVASTATAVVVNVNDVATGGVSITGTVTEDQTLTANSTLADDDGLGVLNYQWSRGGTPIAGATASTLLLGDADVGSTISLSVSYTDLHGTAEGPFTSGPTAAVANVNDVPTGSVSITGTATEDQTLTASNTLADADGLGPISYQWRRGGVPIAGATASTYTLGDADVGQTITVVASYTDLQGTAESVASSATAVVANVNDVPTGSVSIAGTATEDQVLTASNTLADADGLGPITYQWRRGGTPIAGASASTYTLVDADVGLTITVDANYTDLNGSAESVASAATAVVVNVNDAATGGVSITGTLTEDQTLTANSTLADDDGLGVLNYQWSRGGTPIAGATASTLLLGDADVGSTISLSVSYTDLHGTSEGPFTAGPTGAVLNVNDAPTGLLSIVGTPAVGTTVSAQSTLNDADGLGVLSYQWNLDGVPIAGATAATYVVRAGDVGRALTVTASYVDGHGTAESVTSAPVSPVVGGNRLPTGSVTISGNAVEEQTLSATQTLADADGLGPFSYQWRRDGEEIVGATATSYILGDLDVGHQIRVVVSYIDGRGTPESVSSAAVGPVHPEGTALPFQKRMFFVNPASNLTQQSFLRFINRQAQSVMVELRGIDDSGEPAPLGVVTFDLGAQRALQVTSQDLELGNPGKGLNGRFGTGVGKWQIKVGSSLPIEAMSLIRTPDGFVTNISDTAPKPAPGQYEVYFANPASNPNQQSFIRVVNRSKQSGSVTVAGVDDNGTPAPTGDLSFSLGPQQAFQFNSNDYELGNAAKGLLGALGDGSGKWRLSVQSPLSLEVMSLIRTPDGFLTSLSATAPRPAGDANADKLVLFANPADETQQETFIRIINPTGEAGTVLMSAIDDEGVRSNPPIVSFEIGPFQSQQFNARDLETGNPAKGLIAGFGDGVGRWQITITSLLPLEVLNLVRTPDGFVTNLSERVPKASRFISEVPMLNPGDNINQRSFLRLINGSGVAGSAIISGVDDAGQPASGGSIVVDLAANASVELSASDLEQGNPVSGQLGAFGKGTGKWRLSIEADVDVDAQALLETPNGFITNTSQPIR